MAFFNDTCTYHLTKEQIIKKNLSIKSKKERGNNGSTDTSDHGDESN